MPEILFDPSKKYSPFYFRWNGRRFFSKTREEAAGRLGRMLNGKPKLTLREADEYLHCRTLLGNVPLRTAVRFYLEHNPTFSRTKLVSEAADELLAKLEVGDGRPKYLQEYRRNLRVLKKVLGETMVGDVTPQVFAAAMAKLSTYHSQVDFRKYASLAFREWKEEGLVRVNPAREVKKPRRPRIKGRTRRKGFLSLPDAKLLLDTARTYFPSLTAGLAFQMFLGIRTSEVERLTWDLVHAGKSIIIEPWVGKEGEAGEHARRDVIDWWPPNLSAWLPDHPPRSEIPVVPRDYVRERCALLKRCGELRAAARRQTPELVPFAFRQNALRHSFATYAMAHLESADKVAIIMRHTDAGLVWSTYRDYVDKDAGDAYYRLRPDAP